MTISKAEKERRKNKKIYDYFDYWLNRLEECYKKDEDYDNFKECFDHIIAFTQGCCLADGIKWNKRLNKRFSDWLDNHQGVINEHNERVLEKKMFEKCNSAGLRRKGEHK